MHCGIHRASHDQRNWQYDYQRTGFRRSMMRSWPVTSRTGAAIVGALDEWIERRRRRLIGEAIVTEYTRLPQQDAEVGWVRKASQASIAAEPW